MRRTLGIGLAVALALCVCSPALGAGSGRIPLRIDNPCGLDEPWPMVCGVPFSRGTRKGLADLRLEDAQGRPVPCQFTTAATWLDGSQRWVFASFLARPDARYSVRVGGKVESPRAGIRVTRQGGGLTVNTGAAEFFIGNTDALISRATISGRPLMSGGGQGAYVVDNRGREARLGGPSSQMKTTVLTEGPCWTVVRKEGWYVVPKTRARLARGIVWLHFYGGCPYVRIVHRLVLTEPTRKVWFKDIGLDFPIQVGGDAKAVFDVSKAADDKTATVPLAPGDTAWMLQDDFPHFMSKSSHFALVHKTGGGERKVAEGKACGEWVDLRGRNGGCAVVLRDLAEQFPKELTATPKGVTVHLWAGRCGRELDFRTKTLIKEYWGEWTKYADAGVDGVGTIESDAQCSAKTHTVWLLPHEPKAPLARVAKLAHTAERRVVVATDPTWTCNADVMGPPMLPRSPKRYPEAEAFISDFFDRIVNPNQFFPLTGYIAWGANPCTRYGVDKKTGKVYAVWWRVSALVDYYLRKNTWTLYARSLDRKYFDFGERLNRFAGDLCMHHWDAPVPKGWKFRYPKVKGGFTGGMMVKKRLKGGEGAGSYPIYWRAHSYKPGGSGADICNHLLQFYLTGDWDQWEYADNFGQAVQKHKFLQTAATQRGAMVPLRYMTWLYSMRWDKRLGAMTNKLARDVIDLKAPNAVSPRTPPHALYKIGRNSLALLAYYRLTGSDLTRKAFIKMIDYQYRFQLRDHRNPIAYQNASGMYYTNLWRLTGQRKYLGIVKQSYDATFEAWRARLAKEKAADTGKGPRLNYYTQCLNYQACLNMPVMLWGLSEYKGEFAPVPLLTKTFDSTSRAWAVFEKTAGKPVDIEALFKVFQHDDVRPVLIGPDLRPARGLEVVSKEKKVEVSYGLGVKTYAMRLRLPASLPAGRYRLGQQDPGDFTILDANVTDIALECPDGVWIVAGTPTYFRVPDGVTEVKLFAGRPIEIKRGDGSVAQRIADGRCGELTIPVKGKAGDWEMNAEYPALVRLRNVPPFAATLTPARLFTPTDRVPAPKREVDLPDPKAVFVKGVFGQALQLRGRETAKFARGKALPKGGYENFPGALGTIEFFFRPNWSATDAVRKTRTETKWQLLDAGPVALRYRFGQRFRFYAFFDFFCGRSKYKARGRYQIFGAHARYFPKAGEWVHIALTWDSRDAFRKYNRRTYNSRSETARVFVNGRRYERLWSSPGKVHFRLGDRYAKNYTLDGVPEQIALGPGDGTFDEIRISDVIRYTKSFAPPTKPFSPDRHTRALIHFDGDLTAIGGGGRPLKVAHKKGRR